jgi:hypothetical protein
MGENVFCDLACRGRDSGVMPTWGNGADVEGGASSVIALTFMNDLPQTMMEPLLVQDGLFARHASADVAVNTSRHEQDADGVTTTVSRSAKRQDLHGAVDAT